MYPEQRLLIIVKYLSIKFLVLLICTVIWMFSPQWSSGVERLRSLRLFSVLFIFGVIKKWLYSDHDIFVRELISNGCDAVTKLKKLSLMGEFDEPDEPYRIDVTTSANDKTILALPVDSVFVSLI